LRVLIKVLGGPSIGIGHVIRSLELAEELQRRGVVVAGFLCNQDSYSQGKIKSKGFECISTRWADAEEAGEELVEIITLRGADVLILDHPGDFSHLCKDLKKALSQLLIVALDNFALDNEYLDMIINVFNHNPVLKVPTSKRIYYYEGDQYCIVRSSFDGYIKRKKTIHRRVQHVLVTFGGSDPKCNTIMVIEALTGGFLMNVTFHFVLGAHLIHKDAVRRRVLQLPIASQIYEDSEDIEDLMYHCDIGLCGAGTTMMEMACLGTPAIILAQSENEARFADHFEQCGAVMTLGLTDKLSADAVREAVIDLAKDQAARQRMSIAGKCLIDGRGRERVVELIVRNYKFFRNADV